VASRTGRRLLGLAVLLLCLLGLAAWVGLRGLSAEQHLGRARGALQAARTAIEERRLDAAARQVEAAGRETRAARTLTGDPAWRALAAVPIAGRTLQVARGVAVGADDFARQVLPPALQTARLVDPRSVRRPDGSIDVALLRRATPGLVDSRDAAVRTQAELVDLPTSLVAGPVGSGRDQLRAQTSALTSTLDGATRALQLAPALLGQDRPRRFFVAVQQTSESRGTGGLIGGYAVLQADKGRLKVTAQGSNADLKNGTIPVPKGVPQDFVDLYGDNGAFQLWQNANLSPDLPVVARVLAARWKKQSGQDVDGVAVLDATALADLLQGSGPVAVAKGRRIRPDQLEDYLAVGQYRDFAPPTRSSAIDQSSARKEQLTVFAKAVTARLTAGGGSSEQLLRGLSTAVRSGHLRMASDEPALGPPLHAAGVDGALPEGPAPVAYAVVSNATGGKLDHFVDRRVTYTAGSCRGSRRRSTITLQLTNRAPATALPPYLTTRITGAGTISSTTDALLVQVYGTRGADLVRGTVDGRPVKPEDPAGPFLSNEVEASLPIWSLVLELPRGQTRALTLELTEPVSAAGAARVPEQPLARPLLRDVRVPTCP